MRIVITGGAGFIGSHIADAYAAAGHDVLVIDSLWEHGGGRRANVRNGISLVHMDVRDEAIARVFADFKPEIVSHHAAQHSVAISARDPVYDASVNVVGLLNVLEHASKNGARKVIYASSGATFGTPDRLPITDATPQHPSSPYGITKMVGEHYLRFYRENRGLDFTALRYGNVYGPRQDPNGEAGVIAIFIGKFLAHAPVRIGCGRRHGPHKFLPAHVVATGAGHQQSAGAEHFERPQIQFFVAAQCAFNGAYALGERGRIEHDCVEFFASI